jgi:PAS domain S-box-containing protein
MVQPLPSSIQEWSVQTPPFLKAILDCVAQPVWVVDHEGLILFANPAALAALGYDDLSELEGKPSHETIHYKHPDGSDFPDEDCPLLRPRTTGETVHTDLDWFFRRDGTMFPVSYWSAPIDTPSGRGAVLAFTDIEEPRKAERAERERDIAQARENEARTAQRRIVEAGFAARRQVTRDLHDGAQQRLVHAVITLKLALRGLDSGDGDVEAHLREALEHAERANSELRELVHGILPSALTSGGLRAGVNELAARAVLPVSADVLESRFPQPIEATAYFVVSEALTNAIKHSRAQGAEVDAHLEDGTLLVEVRDDGVGGADPGRGSGLTGLRDRVEALSGTIEISSPVGRGTSVMAKLPAE